MASYARTQSTEPQSNVRAASYFIAEARRCCWRCGTDTRVHGFVLPARHQTLCVDDADSASDTWDVADAPSILSYISYLLPAVVTRMQARTSHYRMRYSADVKCKYWMNSCEYCRAKLCDADTFDEPGLGFLAFTPAQARRITLTRIDAPFAASCGSYSIGIEFFRFMRLV